MGKAHSNALRTLSYIDWPGAVRPELVAIAARTEERVADAAVRFGFEGYYTDWRGLVADERLSVFDNAAANEAHMEPTLAAIAAGKHVFCEKPLARRATDALQLWTAAQGAGVKHLCCYNYRFVPAVQLARDILRDGALGEICQGRFRYSQSWGSLSPDGSLVTIGCHAIDQARFLMGEIASVSALFSDPLSRPGDAGRPESAAPGDIVTALVRFAGGASGTIDASGYATSRRNMLAWEVNCEGGTLAWDLERLNELRVSATGVWPTSSCASPGTRPARPGLLVGHGLHLGHPFWGSAPLDGRPSNRANRSAGTPAPHCNTVTRDTQSHYVLTVGPLYFGSSASN